MSDAYKAHLEAISARNDAARAAGRAARRKREDAEDADRRAVEKRQNANLRRASGHAGAPRGR